MQIILFYIAVNILLQSVFCEQMPRIPEKDVEVEEWVILNEGQPVPEGMHVKIDLETGIKMFRHITDDSESEDKKIAPIQTKMHTNDQMLYDHIASLDDGPETNLSPTEAMLEALKRLPESEQSRLGVSSLLTDTPEAEQKIREIWKERQAEILQIAEQMLKPAEVLNDLISCLKSPTITPENEIIQCLEDLEEHLSDIDMARDFHTLEGFPYLWGLIQNLSISDEIRSLSLLVVGTAVKNTEEMQVYVLEKQQNGETGLAILMSLLISNQTTDKVRARALYALGSCLRGNEVVQSQFVSLGGPKKMIDFFSNEKVIERKVLLKLISLINDLLSESFAFEKSDSPDIFTFNSPPPILEIKSSIFDESDWCKVIINGIQIPGRPAFEEALNALMLMTSNNLCVNELQQNLKIVQEKVTLFHQSLLETLQEEDEFVTEDEKILLEKIIGFQSILTPLNS